MSIGAEGSKDIAAAVEEYRKPDALGCSDFGGLQGYCEDQCAGFCKGRQQRIHRRERLDNRRHEMRTEEDDDRFAGNGIRAQVDAIAVKCGEGGAWWCDITPFERRPQIMLL